MKLKALLFMIGGLMVGVLFGALILINGNFSNQGASRRLPPTVGSAVMDFTLKNLGGNDVKISSLKGKPFVINFWATWCPPCKEEMPLLEHYSKVYANEINVVGVNYVEDQQTVQQFVQDEKITFPILLDQDGGISEMYFVRNYPMTFFFDAEGILRAQHLGQLTDAVMIRYLGLIGIRE